MLPELQRDLPGRTSSSAETENSRESGSFISDNIKLHVLASPPHSTSGCPTAAAFWAFSFQNQKPSLSLENKIVWVHICIRWDPGWLQGACGFETRIVPFWLCGAPEWLILHRMFGFSQQVMINSLFRAKYQRNNKTVQYINENSSLLICVLGVHE